MVFMSDNYYKDIGVNPFREYSSETEEKEALAKAIKRYLSNYDKVVDDKNKREAEKERVEQLYDPKFRRIEKEKSQAAFRSLFQKYALKVAIKRTNGTLALSRGDVQEVMNSISWKDDGKFISYDDVAISKKFKADIEILDVAPINKNWATLQKNLSKHDYTDIFQFINNTIKDEGDANLGISDQGRVSRSSSFSSVRSIVNLIEQRLSIKPDFSNKKVLVDICNSIKTFIVSSEQSYRDYLEYTAYLPAYEYIDENKDDLNKDTISDFLTKHRLDTDDDKATIIRKIEDYTLMKGYRADYSGLEVTRCQYCGYILRGSNLTFCTNCGRALVTTCLKCKKEIPSDAKSCPHCGFDHIRAEKDIAALKSKLQQCLISADLSAASDCVKGIEKIFPDHPELSELRSRVDSHSRKLNPLLEDLKKSMDGKRFHRARQVSEEILGLSKECTFALESKKIANEMIDSVRKLIDQTRSNDPNAEYEAYLRASMICLDDPNISAYLRNHPPKAPSKLHAEAMETKFVLSATAINQGGIVQYRFYRRTGSAPSFVNESELIGVSPIPSFIDNNVQNGVVYHYYVTAERGEIASAEYAVSAPVALYPKIRNLKVTPFPDMIQMNFVLPNGCTGAIVKRKSEGIDWNDAVSLPVRLNDGIAEVTDVGLKPRVRYEYSVVAKYGQNTSGIVTTSAELMRLPAPPAMSLKQGDGTFTATFIPDPNLTILYSDSKLKNNSGFIRLSDLKSKSKEVSVVRRAADSITFKLGEGLYGYVFPAIVVGEAAVIGNAVSISTLKDVSDISYSQNGNVVQFHFKIPENATDIRFVWNESQYPKGSDDAGCSEKTLGVESIRSSGNVATVDLSGQKAYLTIYTLYGKRISSGTNLLIVLRQTEIHYKISLKKAGFLQKSNVLNITFRTEAKTIPGMVLVCGDVATPRHVNDGEEIISTDQLIIFGGRRDLNFNLSTMPRSDKFALFFKDPEEYKTYILVRDRS